MRLHLMVVGLLALAGDGARAELVLDVAQIAVKPRPEQDTVKVSFTFRNAGAKAVTIGRIESACSCLNASLDRSVYEPGESGEGEAEFKVSSFVGRHEKTVVVATDDPEQPEWTLPFVLEVPAVVEIEPRTLQWWVGEAADEKVTTLKMVGETPMKILNVTSTRDSVDFSVEEVTPGREYRIKVTPKSTDQVVLGALKVETDSVIPKYQRQLAYFSVFRKPDSAKP